MEDKLQLYVSVSGEDGSSSLVGGKDKQHHPIYFVSHVLAGEEQRYGLLEKISYTVLIVARKLWCYFDSHTIQVLTS